MTEPISQKAWHVDRTINLSIVFMFIAQFAGGIWWVSGVSNRLDTAIVANERQEDRIKSLEDLMNAQAVNAATLTAQLTAMRESLSDLKTSQAETNRLLRNLVPQGVDP
jgi:Tfp pilus assembly protein PilO